MYHTHFAQSIAAATVVAMLALPATAFAQTSQSTPTNPKSTSSQGTQPLVQTTSGAETPIQCGVSSPADTNENRSSKGGRPIESSGSASNSPSGPTTSGAGTSDTENADCPSGGTTSAPGNMINHGYRHAPNGQPAGASSGTMNANGRNMNKMANTLHDNPNGSNWMSKYNRPNVAANYHHHRTNALGTTTSPPKP